MIGERQHRLGQVEIQRFTVLLANLSIMQDTALAIQYVENVLPLTREYSLSAYDAAYLELAIRQEAPFATLDRKLRVAAQKARVVIFQEELLKD